LKGFSYPKLINKDNLSAKSPISFPIFLSSNSSGIKLNNNSSKQAGCPDAQAFVWRDPSSALSTLEIFKFVKYSNTNP